MPYGASSVATIQECQSRTIKNDMKNVVVKSKIWGKIRRELHPAHLFKSRQLIPAIVSGALVGFMTTLLSISFAALVFGKALPEALSIGIGMALFSNVI
jgi:hypothetical protein